jgi:hypothetical protein
MQQPPFRLVEISVIRGKKQCVHRCHSDDCNSGQKRRVSNAVYNTTNNRNMPPTANTHHFDPTPRLSALTLSLKYKTFFLPKAIRKMDMMLNNKKSHIFAP